MIKVFTNPPNWKKYKDSNETEELKWYVDNFDGPSFFQFGNDTKYETPAMDYIIN